MTRGNARELAVHLIYGRAFTGEEPEQVVSIRLEKDSYNKLSQDNDVYAERPSRAQMGYIDTVVAGVANRTDELNDQIQKYSIGWDISRISRLTRTVMQLAIFEILYMDDKIPNNFGTQYDYIAIGSDQIWNYSFERSFSEKAFGCFVPEYLRWL